VGHTFNFKRDYFIPADDVARTESTRHQLAAGI
jgi:cytochrome o ubiquinol oxidase subunit 1